MSSNCVKQFGGKCKPDSGCILNQDVKDSTGKVVSIKELPGYSGPRGCCDPGNNLPFPSECIGSGGDSESNGCNIGYHAEYGSYSLYNNNKEVGSVDSCKKCGQYYIRDEYGICHHLEYDPMTNSCMEGDMVADKFCKSGKSSFSRFTNVSDKPQTNKLLMVILLVALMILIITLFGKKR